ncbi:MAG: glycogen/starch synthase [Flavobacteriales bacterium]|nr:glycogen/starch synthase [Flavobacteriales bacterium]MDG1779332.1 glycogen/starch synthase [Flavobacteriales bacterium]MDG2246313.1 glycogen/starch synthase [Flavobacteriales bacterium]
MSKAKILYVSQEIVPFLPETPQSRISRNLPQGAHEKGKEIRVFMPRYGKINERRHQLHEVIRLSGMNLIINDTDHPLIIKVASIPVARMQVYFIDNEEYFKRKAFLRNDDGDLFEDSDERSIFFVRGVLETVKKLGWVPDVIHCHGWMSALLPLYVKELYSKDPHFANSKVVFSAMGNDFEGSLDAGMSKKVALDGIAHEKISQIDDPTFNNLSKLAIQYSDGVIVGSEDVDADLRGFISESEIASIESTDENNIVTDATSFYDSIIEGKQILVEE